MAYFDEMQLLEEVIETSVVRFIYSSKTRTVGYSFRDSNPRPDYFPNTTHILYYQFIFPNVFLTYNKYPD